MSDFHSYIGGKEKRSDEEKVNNSNDGCFGKRFVKVYFNVLHQRLACELPPARVTAAFSVKGVKKKNALPLFGGQDCLCGKWGLKRTSARPDLLTFTVYYHHFTANSSLPLDTSRAQGKTWRAPLDPLVVQCLNGSISSLTPTPPFRLPPCPSADSYKEQWLESPSMKWDGPSRPSYCISCCRWCLCELTWLDISNTPSSAVMIPLALLWQSWYYYNAVCHLSDKDGKAWILTVCSQLLSINRVIT